MPPERIIELLNSYQANCYVRQGNHVVPADPITLANNLLLIRGLLIQLVDEVSKAEKAYRNKKASMYDFHVTNGLKASPAQDAVDRDMEVQELRIEAERLRNYMKYTDGICTSIQSVLKVYSTSEKSQY